MGGDYTRIEAHWLAGGCGTAMLIVGAAIGFGAGRTPLDTGMPQVPAVGTAQAAEEERVNLFAIDRPHDACDASPHWDGHAVAWHRDERFATRLRVWCVEKASDAEASRISVWSQSEGDASARWEAIQRDFYPHRMIEDGEAKDTLADACGENGFLGWSKAGLRAEGDVIRRGDGEHRRIVGFTGGMVWCLGKDLYALNDGNFSDGNPYDHRFDVGKGVGTEWND